MKIGIKIFLEIQQTKVLCYPVSLRMKDKYESQENGVDQTDSYQDGIYDKFALVFQAIGTTL